MAQPEDRAVKPIPSEVDPLGFTEALYAADDNLGLDAGVSPHNGDLDHQPGRKTRQARKNEISKKAV